MNYRFRDRPINNQRLELNEKEIDEIFVLAERVLNEEFPRIDENNFRRGFNDENVDRDIEDNDKRKKGFDNKSREYKRGVILEALLMDLFQNHWFEDLNFKRSSEHDDHLNGVDAIVTETDSPSAYGLSIDPTTSAESFTRKASKIKAKGGLTNIDYFENGNFRGKLTAIPHVALFLNDELFAHLARLWRDINLVVKSKDDKSTKDRISNAQKIIENHPAKLILLLQMELQLKQIKSRLQKKPTLTESEKFSLQITEKYLRNISTLIAKVRPDVNKEMDLREYEFKVDTHRTLITISNAFNG